MPNLDKNHLAEETSPYLLQHKDNPVHWHPWGDKALELAKTTGKPILLSVGYAACHWCHVMAHESFENPETAALMNEHYINIKVDREERPDIDAIYMEALHHLGQQGGWPLTMFLTPAGDPFWGGTYFPPAPKYGQPSFPNLLLEIARIFKEEPEKVQKNRQALLGALRSAPISDPKAPPVDMALKVAERLLPSMDPVNGGLTGAPKFPQAALLELLWRAYLSTNDEKYAAPVQTALNHMSEGGIYDHLRGGFSRYSVDAGWLVPHFEKMLYDNALLLSLMTLVWQHTKDPRYAARIAQTIDWVSREMITQNGAFAASLDADSEGVEGKFYVWSAAEIQTILQNDAALFGNAYDVSVAGNWEEANILNRLAHADAPFDTQLDTQLAPLRARLMAVQDTRIRPAWDDKVLTDWNGLMIKALAEAGQTFDQPDWITLAKTAYQAILRDMTPGGRLAHAWRQTVDTPGRAQHKAMSDGLANMIGAALTLFEIETDETYLENASTWARELDDHYWDQKDGGYFFTADDAEGLIRRTRTANDGAMPAANGTMIANLSRLYAATGEENYRHKAEKTLEAFSADVSKNAFPLGTYLTSLDTYLNLTQFILVLPSPDTRETITQSTKEDQFRQEVFALSCPTRFFMTVKTSQPLPSHHPASGKTCLNNEPTLYICQGTLCSAPLTDPTQLKTALAQFSPDAA